MGYEGVGGTLSQSQEHGQTVVWELQSSQEAELGVAVLRVDQELNS